VTSDAAPGAAPGRPRPRRWRRRALWTLAVVAVLLTPASVVQVAGHVGAVGVDDAREADAILVLGAGLRPDGTPSVYLTRRLQAAAALYAHGAAPRVVVSGDGVERWHDEPGAMHTWLVEHGVPDAAVVEDPQGIDTWSSCRRARDELGLGSVVVVTQDYHLPRAVFSCRAVGLGVQGVGVSAQSVHPMQAFTWHLREVPASSKAAWDALVRALG